MRLIGRHRDARDGARFLLPFEAITLNSLSVLGIVIIPTQNLNNIWYL